MIPIKSRIKCLFFVVVVVEFIELITSSWLGDFEYVRWQRIQFLFFFFCLLSSSLSPVTIPLKFDIVQPVYPCTRTSNYVTKIEYIWIWIFCFFFRWRAHIFHLLFDSQRNILGAKCVVIFTLYDCIGRWWWWWWTENRQKKNICEEWLKYFNTFSFSFGVSRYVRIELFVSNRLHIVLRLLNTLQKRNVFFSFFRFSLLVANGLFRHFFVAVFFFSSFGRNRS